MILCFFLKQFNPEFPYDSSILVFRGMILYVKYIVLSEKHKIIDVPLFSSIWRNTACPRPNLFIPCLFHFISFFLKSLMGDFNISKNPDKFNHLIRNGD
jgi:hypothetical protein